MTPPTDNAIVEIKTDMAEIKSDLRNLISRLNGYVPEHCISHSERITTLTNEISAMKANQLWIWRAIGGTIIGAGLIPFVRIIFHV